MAHATKARPALTYRAARRNAWRAIPKKDRPSWSDFAAANPTGRITKRRDRKAKRA